MGALVSTEHLQFGAEHWGNGASDMRVAVGTGVFPDTTCLRGDSFKSGIYTLLIDRGMARQQLTCSAEGQGPTAALVWLWTVAWQTLYETL